MTINIFTEEDLCLNLLLTSICNAGCSWCIANEYMMGKKTLELISDKNVEEILDRLKKESVKQVNLLGGEPSLHPEALEIGKKIHNLNIPVGFSTNGLWKDDFRKKFEKVDYPLEVEVTYLGSSLYTNENNKKLERTFEQLKSHSTSLGLIIASNNQPYKEHLGISEKYGFDLRWTFVEPTIRSGLTEGYKEQSMLKTMGRLATKVVREANRRGIDTWADLTIPRCAIGENDISLFEGEQNDIQFRCPPFFDISPNLDIWRCLPMAPKKTPKITDYQTFREAYRAVNTTKDPFNEIGIFYECKDCNYMKDICSGGPAIAKQLKKDEN